VFNIYFLEFAKLLGGPGPPRPLPTLRHWSTILRGTATTSLKAKCVWDSGSLIVLDTVDVMTLTQAGIQCPGSLLRKFPNLRLRSRDETSIPA